VRQSFSNYQKELDDAAEIEARADELREQANEALTKLNRFDYDVLTDFGTLTDDYKTDFDVMEAVDDLSRDEVTLAFAKLDSDPLEAVRILKEARDKAVRHVVGLIDFENSAKAERELSRRDVA